MASEPPGAERPAAPSRSLSLAATWALRLSSPETHLYAASADRRHPRAPFFTSSQTLAVALIVGFLLVDFLFFHDIFKAGEAVTFAQYLTGVLSIPVLVVSALYLLRGTGTLQKYFRLSVVSWFGSPPANSSGGED